jgi:hypothetical protein
MVSLDSSRSSGTPRQSRGGDIQCPAQRAPGGSNRSGATAGSSGPTSAKNGTLRRSWRPRVLAVLTRIRNSQVRSDERPWKRPSCRSMPSQASWATSSATARSPPTYAIATPTMAAWWRLTSEAKAASSPSTRRVTSSRSVAADVRAPVACTPQASTF